jgi:tripartite-type tricarboxylate transporter receptor subunit TctC
MVIDNRPRAGTGIATEAAARAAPDGNTILLADSNFVIIPHFRKLNYDPRTCFEPICQLVSSPQVLVVNSASPYHTLADLLNGARAKPGELTLASVGPASLPQIGFEMLKQAANVDITFVPYPGVAAAVNALLGGHVTSVFSSYASLAEQVKVGALRALATATRTRIEPLPDVPKGGGGRLRGLRGRPVGRGGCSSENTGGCYRETRRLVCRGAARTRNQAEARRPGTVSGRDVRCRFRCAHSQTI